MAQEFLIFATKSQKNARFACFPIVQKRYPLVVLLLILGLFLLLTGCSPKMNIVYSDVSTPLSVTFSTGLEHTAEAAFKSMTGEDEDAQLFSGPAITRALCDAGFTHVITKETGTAAFVVSCSLPQEKDSVFPFTVTKTTGKNVLSFTLTPDHVSRIMASLPEDFGSYADLMMAPVLTGDGMALAEYVELIGAAYGTSIANDLSSSVFELSVTLPGPAIGGEVVLSHKTYKAVPRGKTITIFLPVAAILVETQNIAITAEWK